MEIQKILVANRGEIALRVMRSAREMGIKTVAVYSDADKLMPHTLYADEAIHLGASPSSESYLDHDKIIEACRQTNADALHPGYGFLSENENFAKRCKLEGINFIGPSPEAIRIMGDKLTSKQTVAAFNVPLVPGMKDPINDVEKAKEIATQIGYPIMIKASAGGGGKGMRIVLQEADFENEMERAMSEARNAFGDDKVFIEKFIQSPKHIEVQVLGDQHGNVLHLFERECSVQRRHQKVIEEAPSGFISKETRALIGNAAVNVAKSCSYYGAGTVEFIMDDKQNFYFLEMNTRLQVEHPVTEMITGIDLVKEQIRIAEGNPISFKQEDLSINGHSIEVRVYAEDPKNNFLPDIGKLIAYERPQGPGIRLDDGYEKGLEIPIYYDPMIAKLIVHADDRAQAIDRMQRAISEYKITGVSTTLSFCSFVLDHPVFKDASFTTKFMEEHFSPEKLEKQPGKEEIDAALIAIAHFLESDKKIQVPQKKTSNWRNRLHA